MIKKLRLKFIILSMIAVIVLLAAIVAGMNIINYNSVVKDADSVLDVLSGNKGQFPQDSRDADNEDIFNNRMNGERPAFNGNDPDHAGDYFDDFFDDDFERMPHGMSPEVPYESRFFSVLLDENGEVESCDISRIKAVDNETAEEYGREVFNGRAERGFIGNYRYVKIAEDNNTRVIFLDSGRKMESFHSFLNASLLMAGAGIVLFFIVIFLFSKRIVRPAAEAYEKQKRFISDAGHEIKTPLTIISADADILEMDNGSNEWIDDIKKQTERLTSLTNDLIYLSKTEEGASSMTMIEFPISDVVEEMTDSFSGLAKSQNKTINKNIEQMLEYTGDEKAITQLVSILIDNAIKYSPQDSMVDVTLKKQGKGVMLSVFNKTEDPIEKEKLQLLFDRFYRTDASRNSKAGGYGIGLSMAKAITEAHGGKIYAKSEDENSLLIVAELP